ncbi:MAG: hypothetical protein A3K14_00300 [Sulfurimonas sp. RIFCSPLOWO2_12_FULL_36_74]|nr:MAG: hypothetical protein A3J26_01785 [Sulfurimonas sp. RIFCSPLOWO2_02_FULL_36_28]OHE07343.1 MAG: hypothetical protein A3K14_00300 [Sulfurimonas sp. RIFCSPLOWO2_12_FULL_36_74]
MMDIKYEYLELLPMIKDMLIQSSSPYLSRQELSNYLKVSESFIKQKLYNGEFEESKHYFKIGESKMLFDRLEIDKWIRAKGSADGKPLCQKQQTLSKYISQRSKDY